jgi:hypothetical protein
MVSCCSGGLAVRRAATWPYVLGVKEDAGIYLHTKYIVPRSWRWAKVCPKHVELILEINK